jgi:hypothetical protein
MSRSFLPPKATPSATKKLMPPSIGMHGGGQQPGDPPPTGDPPLGWANTASLISTNAAIAKRLMWVFVIFILFQNNFLSLVGSVDVDVYKVHTRLNLRQIYTFSSVTDG